MYEPFIALLLLTGVGGVAVSGLAGVRVLVQRNADIYRKRYLITFPADTKFEEHSVSFIRSLGAIGGTGLRRLNGMPSVVFEILADESGIRHYLTAPSRLADYVISQLRAKIPGAHYVFQEDDDYQPWDEAVEVGMTSARVPLRMPSPDAVVNTLLASFAPLGNGEALIMQWVVTSGEPQPKDSGEGDKTADAMFVGVGRIAARGKDRTEARKLVRRVFLGLSSLKAYGVSFRFRQIPEFFVRDRLYRRASMIGAPCTFNASELAAVIAFPSGSPSIPGLPRGRSRNLPAASIIPTTGFILAQSDFPGAERPLAISPEDRLKHMQFVGPTGSGKTVAMANVILQEIAQGYGTMVMEPGTDLIDFLLDRIPPSRIKDVVYYNPADMERPIGFNFFEGGNPYLVTQQAVAVLDGLWDIYKLPRTSDVVRAGVLTLTQRGLTLMDLSTLLDSSERGKDFRAATLRKITDPTLKSFWHEFDAMKQSQQVETTAPVMRRLRQLEYWPSLRATLGQINSGFDLRDVIENKKILLVPLNQAAIGEEATPLIGSMLFTKLWQAVQARSSIPVEQRTPFFCHMDEAQNFLNMPVSIRQVLAEARKYGLGLTLAHQDLGQLPLQMRDGFMSNARTKMVFAPTATDASSWEREFSPNIKSADLLNLGEFQIVARISVGGQMAPPATGTTFEPPSPLGSARAAREASRARYGRPLAQVEAELRERYRTFSKPQEKPEIGRVDEGEPS